MTSLRAQTSRLLRPMAGSVRRSVRSPRQCLFNMHRRQTSPKGEAPLRGADRPWGDEELEQDLRRALEDISTDFHRDPEKPGRSSPSSGSLTRWWCRASSRDASLLWTGRTRSQVAGRPRRAGSRRRRRRQFSPTCAPISRICQPSPGCGRLTP